MKRPVNVSDVSAGVGGDRRTSDERRFERSEWYVRASSDRGRSLSTRRAILKGVCESELVLTDAQICVVYTNLQQKFPGFWRSVGNASRRYNLSCVTWLMCHRSS